MRFLRYSLENQKKIRVVLMVDGVITHTNLTVTALLEDAFAFVSAKEKSGKTMPLSCVLSAGYARGDKGENIR